MTLNYQSPTPPIRAGISDPLLSAVAIAVAGLGVNQTVEVSSPSLNVVNPFNNLRPMEGKAGDESTDWSLGSIYEPIRKRVYHSAAPAGYNFNEHAGSGLTIYDIETNQWRRIQNPFDWALGHGYDAQAIDETGIYYRNPIGYGLVHRWDTVTELQLPNIPAPADTISGAGGTWGWTGVGAIGFHPELGAEGSLILQKDTRTARWDKATETWSTLIDKYTSAVSEYPYCHYNPTSEILVTGSEGATGVAFLVDGSGAITNSSPNPQTIMDGGAPTNNLSLFLPAPNSTKSLLFCPIDSKIYALDTLTGVWDAGISMPASMTADSHKMLTSKIGATLHEFNCILIVNYGSGGTSQMHLYRYS